ncbi:nadh-quinone oxidoreductase e subunit [Holotrichia oblita]|nr:nadh-quinone oxidoreductase e subunit [Holotrichia oblita]
MIINGKDYQKEIRALDEFIDSLKGRDGIAIEVLHHAQSLIGYLPEEVQKHIAEKLDIPVAKIYGIASFYSHFSLKPRGKYCINVCMGTACFVKGAEQVLNELIKQLNIKVGETTADGLFTLEHVRCIGACGLAPVMSINGKIFGNVNPKDISKILADCRKGEAV